MILVFSERIDSLFYLFPSMELPLSPLFILHNGESLLAGILFLAEEV